MSKFANRAAGNVDESASPCYNTGKTFFKQSDSKWADKPFGKSGDKTLKSSGGIITALAMAMEDAGITLSDGSSVDPGKLNDYLRKHDGYDGSDNINWKATKKLGINSVGTESDKDKIKNYVNKDGYLALLQLSNSHYVYATGLFKKGICIHDPNDESKKELSMGDIKQAHILKKDYL